MHKSDITLFIVEISQGLLTEFVAHSDVEVYPLHSKTIPRMMFRLPRHGNVSFCKMTRPPKMFISACNWWIRLSLIPLLDQKTVLRWGRNSQRLPKFASARRWRWYNYIIMETFKKLNFIIGDEANRSTQGRMEIPINLGCQSWSADVIWLWTCPPLPQVSTFHLREIRRVDYNTSFSHIALFLSA